MNRYVNYEDPPESNPDEWCAVCGADMAPVEFGAEWTCPNEPHTPEFMAQLKAQRDAEAAYEALQDADFDKESHKLHATWDAEVGFPREMMDGSDDPDWMDKVMEAIAELGIGPEG